MDKIRNIFSKILPIYWAFLTYILLKPISVQRMDYWFLFSGVDKVVHLLAFAGLGFLFGAVFQRVSLRFFLVIMFLYALATEAFQHFLDWGRSMEFWDLLADVLGVLLGYFLSRIFMNFLEKRFF